MGRTYRKNDRWKKDQKDQNFYQSNKFKNFKKNKQKPNPPKTDSEPVEIDDSIDNNI